MPPAVTRELSITYAGFAVGGTDANYLIDGVYRQSRSYDQSSIEFTVMVLGDSAANFAANCLALEAAYRTPRGALTVTMGGTNILAVTHTGNTGFNANPVSAKSTMEGATARSRRYDITVSFTEPADLSGQSGRRTSTVQIAYGPSRKRIVTISGTYTALGGNSALAQYEASAPTYFTAVLTALTGTFEKVNEQPQYDDANKELSFTVVYEEVIFNQAVGVLNNAALVQPKYIVSFSRSSPGDSPEGGARRMATITATFESSVDKTVTTDLTTLWTATVFPYMVQQVQAAAGGLSVALVEKRYDLNGSDNFITATLTFLGVASAVVEYDLTTEINEDIGRRIVPVWGTRPYQAYVVPNPATLERTVTQRIVVFGGAKLAEPIANVFIDSSALVQAGGRAAPNDGQTTGWITKKNSFRESAKTVGDQYTFEITERNISVVQQWVEAPQSGTATG